MTKRILAPIDGRASSEAIVPIIRALARDGGATVRLLRVFPLPDPVVGPRGPIEYADQRMARLTADGEHDLRCLEAQMDGVPVETVVRFGEAVDEILLEAEAFDADLIALAARPRGRLQNAFAPGVADRVTRRSSRPTLTLREP